MAGIVYCSLQLNIVYKRRLFCSLFILLHFQIFLSSLPTFHRNWSFKVSDDVDPAVSILDPKENKRPRKKMKAEKAKDVEEVAIDV